MSFWQKIGLTSKMTRERMAQFVSRYATEIETLDIGCGGAPFAKYFPSRIGFDHAPGPGADVVGDAHKLPFADSSFERILCTEVLEHLVDPPKAIAEMHRVLKPGGLLILTTRFVFPLHDVPHDYWRFTRYGLEYLFRDWEIVELRPEAGSVETLAILIQRLGLQAQFRGGRLMKLWVFLEARFISWLPWLIKREFGDISHRSEVRPMMSSGYYLAVRKRS